jgi:hypothetical protein
MNGVRHLPGYTCITPAAAAFRLAEGLYRAGA